MSKVIEKKVDFIMTIEVNNANPNGDPLAGNMPRTDSFGYGEISDVCIKRKIRNRMQDKGYDIFVKSNEKSDDGFTSLEKRYSSVVDKKATDEEAYNLCCETWLDVRSFGQVITYDKKAVGIRGPVSISIAKSLAPVDITTMQITKSVNSMEKEGGGKSSDTMGSKHYINHAIYVVNGAVNVNFAKKNKFTDDDLAVLKECLQELFINDSSSARPDGSMIVRDIFWFVHDCEIGNVSSGKIKELLEYDVPELEDQDYKSYNIRLNEEKLKEYEEKGLKVEYLTGI